MKIMTGRIPALSPDCFPAVISTWFPSWKSTRTENEYKMNILTMHRRLAPPVPLVAGVHMLIAPHLLNYIVTVCLIVIGIIGLTGGSGYHM
jgi:hypothetical protein